jgi:hypothetical protein
MSTSRNTIRCLVSALAAAAILAAPRLVFACPVCFTGRDDETQLAFRISTGVMTFLPFLLVGGLILWLRRRFRALAEEEERRAAGGSPAGDSADHSSADHPVGIRSAIR